MLVSFVFCLCLLLLMDTSLFLKLAIEELIASESDYLVTLQLIIDGYYRPTKSCISPLELKNNLTTIFGNILDIYQFHSDFFSPQLKECESISDITQCFSCNIANFNIYTLYCSNKYQSSRFLNFYNGNFFKERRKCLNDRLSLQDLLIAPIQRLSQYHLLLKNIQIHSKSKDQLHSLSSVMKLMKQLPEESNDKIHLAMIKDYYGCIENNGKLLFHGCIKAIFSQIDVTTPLKFDLPLDYYVFLFDFLFIVTRKHFSNLSFVCAYKTSSLKILVSIISNNPNSFAVISSDNLSLPRLNVQTMSSFEKYKWLSVFYNLSQEQQIFSSAITNPKSIPISSVDSDDNILDDTNTIFFDNEFEILPLCDMYFELNCDFKSIAYSSQKYGKHIFVVVDDTGSSKCELISLRQLSLNTGDICQLLFNSVSEFSFVRSKRGLDAIDGWVPSKSIQITDISLSSDLHQLEDATFIQFLPHMFHESSFTIDKFISKGAYSIQYRCTQTRGILKDVFALAMKHSNLPRIYIIAEISYVISNENLPTFYGIMRDGKRTFLLFSDCGDQLLFNSVAVKEFYTESDVLKYMLQIWRALDYLLIIGVVHLDIRPENLYLSSERDVVKLIDFTCAQIMTLDGNLRVYQQTKGIGFFSPEQLMGSNIFHSSDQWSSGVIMYTFLYGNSPFGGNSESVTHYNILNGCFSFDINSISEISSNAKDLIGKILQLNQNIRISAAQCLAHPIFSNITQLKHFKLQTKQLRDYLAQRSLQLNN